ncbi:MAG: hypothetical protein D3916_02290 [Candidatus Electrothrix sp. MAN1_4]|nr:hypothetical protein [Candidatus Electrothrix sp. MAN1_4]
MSDYSILIFDGKDDERAQIRLEWLCEKINSIIKPFPACTDWDDTNRRLTQEHVSEKPLLVFIHLTAYSADKILEHVPKWHQTIKRAITLVLYSGGGIKGDSRKEIDKLILDRNNEVGGGIYAIYPIFFEGVPVSHLKDFVSYFCDSCGALSTDNTSSIENFRQNLQLRMENVNRTFSTPNLNAIAIVCQCYIATMLADPEQHANIPETTRSLIGWNRLPAQAKSSLSGRLQQTNTKLQTLFWWAETLSFFDKAKNDIDLQQKIRLQIAIINDMEGTANAETLQEQLTADGDPSDIEAQIFDNVDANKYPKAANVLRLFQLNKHDDSVSIDTVCAAYEALNTFLSPKN